MALKAFMTYGVSRFTPLTIESMVDGFCVRKSPTLKQATRRRGGGGGGGGRRRRRAEKRKKSREERIK